MICFPWVPHPVPLTTEVAYPGGGLNYFCFLFVVPAVKELFLLCSSGRLRWLCLASVRLTVGLCGEDATR